MISLTPGKLAALCVIGAHCDDIPIGLGASLLTLCRSNPGLVIDAYIATGASTPREAEERAALSAFCPGATISVTIGSATDGQLPAELCAIKAQLRSLALRTRATIVFAPQRHDAHQDHRLIAEVIPTEFRDHLTLGYEIPKWESDLPRATLYHPVSEAAIKEKTTLLHRHYQSQLTHDWFDDDTFAGLARIRGVQCRSRYAEAFTLEKAVLGFGE